MRLLRSLATLVCGGLVLALAGCGGDDGDDNGSGGTPVPGTISLGATSYSVNEAASTVTITVARAGGADGAASVQYATSNGTATAGQDYTAASGTLSWANGDSASKNITVTIANDGFAESDETLNVTLSSVSGAALGSPASATLTIASEDASVTLSGIAATGAPVAGATVTLKDRNGTSRSATTGQNGGYSLEISGLTPPFLVRVQSGQQALYSTASEEGTLNVHPFTNLIVTAYYEALGQNLGGAFDSLGATTPLPSDLQVRIIADVVGRILAPFLEDAGLDPAQFDLFTSPFTADGTGFDGLLDATTFANDTDYTVDVDNDGTPEQETDVTANTTAQQVAFHSSTTDVDGNTSESLEQTPVAAPGTQDQLAAALTGVETVLTQALAFGSERGSAATPADMAPFVDTQFLDNGYDAAGMAAQLAAFFAEDLPAGSTATLASIDRVISFVDDADADRLTVFTKIRIAPPQGEPFVQVLRDATSDQRLGVQFRRQADGSWRFYGNQRQFRVDARVERARRDVVGQGAPVDQRQLEVRTQSHVLGSIASAVATSVDSLLPANCNDTNDNSARPLTAASANLTLNANNAGEEDQFELACTYLGITAYPPAGTLYSVTTTPSSGAAVTYDAETGSYTDEPVDIFTINGVSLQEFAAGHPNGASVAGQTLALEVTRPDTFAIVDLSIHAFVENAAQACDGCTGGEDVEGPPLDSRGTSASIAIPATVDGQPVVNVGITILYEGENGERSSAYIQFPD
jgi:hypothetical protein